MTHNTWGRWGLVFFSLFFFSLYVLEIDAFARLGGGRSSGGFRSRSYSMPRSPSSTPTSPSRQYGTSPTRQTAPPSQPSQSGGFLRGLAGGIVGGMLGGMLFRSLGFGSGGGMGGGIGLFDIILIGLVLYGIWWFIKKKRQTAESAAGAGYYRDASTVDYRPQDSYAPAAPYEPPDGEDTLATALDRIRRMDPHFEERQFRDLCLDIFFKLQGAWANRDMTTVRSLLSDEMFGIFQGQVDELRSSRKINRLENIAVRTVDITEAGQEAGKDYITVRFYANLLDYTVDEASGQVLDGSKTDPVKFEEYWTFTRPVGNNPWQLAAVSQA